MDALILFAASILLPALLGAGAAIFGAETRDGFA